MAFNFIGKLCFHTLSGCADSAQRSSSDVRRVLIIRLDEIGDLILSSPLFRRIRSLFRGASITLVVKPGNVELVEYCPYVDEVLVFNQSAPRFAKPFLLPMRAFLFAIRTFVRDHIDVAILPRWDVDESYATFLALFSGAKQRIGFSERVHPRKQLLNRGFDRMLSVAVYDVDLKHEVERNLRIAKELGSFEGGNRLEVWTGPEDADYAARVFKEHHVFSSQPVIGFGVGARHPKRVWPIERFIEVGKWLIQQCQARILVIGAREEEEYGDALATKLGRGVINLVGKTTLRQVAEIFKRTVLLIGNDSAPIHIAAAVGVPVVEISCHPRTGAFLHVNSPERFGPWGVRNAVVRPQQALPPCTDACCAAQAHCITSVTAEEVMNAIESLNVLRAYTPTL